MSKYQDERLWLYPKVRRYADDPDKSFQERFYSLENHHAEETEFLIKEVRKLAGVLELIRPTLEEMSLPENQDCEVQGQLDLASRLVSEALK